MWQIVWFSFSDKNICTFNLTFFNFRKCFAFLTEASIFKRSFEFWRHILWHHHTKKILNLNKVIHQIRRRAEWIHMVHFFKITTPFLFSFSQLVHFLPFTIKALCSISLAGSCGRHDNDTPGSGHAAAHTGSGKCCAGFEHRGHPGRSAPAQACRGRPHKTNLIHRNNISREAMNQSCSFSCSISGFKPGVCPSPSNPCQISSHNDD